MQQTETNQESPSAAIDAALAKALTSPALQWQSNKNGREAYPANYRGRVPLKVRLATTAASDFQPGIIAQKDQEYYVWVNSYGAVSAILPTGKTLGLLPQEFDVIGWHDIKS